ncbi:N-acyl-D-amino-acid deacylase family protein, partial [Steroidobacter sp.]|uniref:N-acyl-D-amino-acid deacylase family protein n=1 Tax=Steroidobacter sp. TaxID=1978227 RepID=UPI001A4163E3
MSLMGVRAVGVAVLAALSMQSSLAYDLVIRQGKILDGGGNPAYVADVAVTGDRIVAIGALGSAPAKRTIDANGLYIVPGFIDLHSHADRGLVSDDVEMRRAVNLITQGITTVVGGPDGGNQRPTIAEELAAFQAHAGTLNLVPMIGHSTVRSQVMGKDYARPATPQEVARMQAIVRDGMERGAWGLSAGLEYRIGRFSRPDEVVALAKMVAPFDGFYIAHQRSEIALPFWRLPSIATGLPIDGTRALAETINIAREAKIRVVASHAKAGGTVSWGTGTNQVRMVNEARAQGLNVYFDQYVYTSAGNNALWNRLPMWAYAPAGYNRNEGNDDPALGESGALKQHRENLRKHLSSPQQRALLEEDIAWLAHQQGGPERLVVLDYPDKSLVGRTVADLARERQIDYRALLIDLALQGYDRPGGVLIRGHAMEDTDIVTF